MDNPEKFGIWSIEDDKLTVEAKGERLGKFPNRIHTEIKAATYHDVNIQKTPSGYEVTIVFDV